VAPAGVRRMEVLRDLWEAEAAFCAGRRRVERALLAAYSQASSWGIPELRPAEAGAPSAKPRGCRVLSRGQVAGAQDYLRGVLVDTVFRWASGLLGLPGL
jgi:hypothetical protein